MVCCNRFKFTYLLLCIIYDMRYSTVLSWRRSFLILESLLYCASATDVVFGQYHKRIEILGLCCKLNRLSDHGLTTVILPKHNKVILDGVYHSVFTNIYQKQPRHVMYRIEVGTTQTMN